MADVTLSRGAAVRDRRRCSLSKLVTALDDGRRVCNCSWNGPNNDKTDVRLCSQSGWAYGEPLRPLPEAAFGARPTYRELDSPKRKLTPILP
jgi:hypothetical protein